ncbi:ion transport 2 domain containing protein [Nitzschia inconspicua]|uniref:Ion transport 2 domain containing protein n=1 Tax=Nitzschia inconspicua TaxID=303405 RepID=A0A9K3KV88_9STRA|nr:ion transport 2 domain containing protein [Nitzschia inconspicua]
MRTSSCPTEFQKRQLQLQPYRRKRPRQYDGIRFLNWLHYVLLLLLLLLLPSKNVTVAALFLPSNLKSSWNTPNNFVSIRHGNEPSSSLSLSSSLRENDGDSSNKPAILKTVSSTADDDKITTSFPLKDGTQNNAVVTTAVLPVPTTSSSNKSITSLSTTTKKMKFRMKLFSFLCQPKVEVASAGAVLLSSLLVALSTLNDLSPDVEYAISSALLMLDLIFAADFFVRWYAAGQFKPLYLTKPLAVIDIVVIILPLAIGTVMPLMSLGVDVLGMSWNDIVSHGTTMTLFPSTSSTDTGGSNTDPLFFQAGLQNLLLLRVLRLRRVLTDMNTFGRFTAALGIGSLNNSQSNRLIRPYQLQLARVLLSIFTLLSVATGLIYTAEHDVNPAIPDYFTALYFGLTSLTTVGFGDITPVTPAGRLIVCGSILAGIAIIPAQAAKLVEALLELQRDQNDVVNVAMMKTSIVTQQRRKKMQYYSGRADGRGPSGLNIEIPAVEEQQQQPLQTTTGATEEFRSTGTSSSKRCMYCGEPSHRMDARFCWSCGNEL